MAIHTHLFRLNPAALLFPILLSLASCAPWTRNEEGLWTLEVPVGADEAEVVSQRGEPQSYRTWKVQEGSLYHIRGEICHYDDLMQARDRAAAYQWKVRGEDMLGIEQVNMGSWDLYFDRERRLVKVTPSEPRSSHLAEVEPRGTAYEWKRRINMALNNVAHYLPRGDDPLDENSFGLASREVSEVSGNLPAVLPDNVKEGLCLLSSDCKALLTHCNTNSRVSSDDKQAIANDITAVKSRLSLRAPIEEYAATSPGNGEAGPRS